MEGRVMSGRKTEAVSRYLAALPPQFRARGFTDAGGRRRFGISVSLNGNRFIGSVPVRDGHRADAGSVAALLESIAAFVRHG
jgi:hypothetical protein